MNGAWGGGTNEFVTGAAVKIGGTPGIGGNCGDAWPAVGLTGGGAQETCCCPGCAGGGAQDTPDPCLGGGTHEFPLRGVVCLLPTFECIIRGVGTIPGSPVKDLERDISREVMPEPFGSVCAETAWTMTG